MSDPGHDSSLFEMSLPRMTLEAGAALEHHVVRGWFAGPAGEVELLAKCAVLLDDDDSGEVAIRRDAEELDELAQRCAGLRGAEFDPTVPTIVVVHALTGHMAAGGVGGWWDPVIGPDRALDPRNARIVCFNNLGSCYGTSGPADAHFPRRVDDAVGERERYSGRGAFDVRAEMPATVTTWDQARSILLALDRLGLRDVHLAVGGSLGGMIVLSMAALDPTRFRRVAPVAASEAASPWIIAWNHIQRQTVLMDPGFPADVSRGLALARELAHVTYRAEAGLIERQARRMAGDDRRAEDAWHATQPYAVQTYLEYQGRKLVGRFDGMAYLAQIDAMDSHDLRRQPPAPEACESWPATVAGEATRRVAVGSWGVARIRASILTVGINTDQLYLPHHMAELADRLMRVGVHAEHYVIRSRHGHDAFLIEWDQVATALRKALALPSGVLPAKQR